MNERAASGDEEDQIKELYARAGLALFFAQVLEHGVVNALVVLDLIPSSRDQARSRSEWASMVDEYMDSRFALTMGQMLTELRAVTSVPGDTDALLRRALITRNLLVHRYFRERVDEGMSPQGRAAMVEELAGFRDLFKEADGALDELVRPIARRHGITDELIAEAVRERYPDGQP